MTNNEENNKNLHKLFLNAFELELVDTSKYQDLQKTVYNNQNNHIKLFGNSE